MRKLLLAAVAAASLVATLPAAAQTYYGDRADRIERRIDRSVQNGAISWGQARSLRAQLNATARLENRYRSDGLSNWEARDLDRRYDSIDAQLRGARDATQYRYERNRWYGY